MIDNAKRLPVDFLCVFALQFALAKYPYVFAGETVPTNIRELGNMALISMVGALLIENLFWRVKSLRGRSGSKDRKR